MSISKRPTRQDLTSLVNWLLKKIDENADATYDPGNPRHCLVCQFLTDQGFKNVWFQGSRGLNANEHQISLPMEIAEIAYGDSAANREEPFTRAYERALEVLAAYND